METVRSAGGCVPIDAPVEYVPDYIAEHDQGRKAPRTPGIHLDPSLRTLLTIGSIGICRKIGEGSYSWVYQGRMLDCTGPEGALVPIVRQVALKVFKSETDPEAPLTTTTLREVEALRVLKGHPNIIDMIHVYVGQHVIQECQLVRLPTYYVAIVMEYMPIDMHHYVKTLRTRRGYGLGGRTLRSCAYQLMKGLEYCHEHNIIHRDFKTENVAMAADGTVKILDFGLCKHVLSPVPDHHSTEVVTMWYRPLELFLFSVVPYGFELDVWSLGIVLAELMLGEFLFTVEIDVYMPINILETFLINPILHSREYPEQNGAYYCEETPLSSFEMRRRYKYKMADHPIKYLKDRVHAGNEQFSNDDAAKNAYLDLVMEACTLRQRDRPSVKSLLAKYGAFLCT